MRPHVLTHAQRRHTARIFHRDRKLDPELRATLDALHSLPLVSRKALVLADLSSASPEERAREIGLPLDEAERRLLDARVQFVDHREDPGHRDPADARAAGGALHGPALAAGHDHPPRRRRETAYPCAGGGRPGHGHPGRQRLRGRGRARRPTRRWSPPATGSRACPDETPAEPVAVGRPRSRPTLAAHPGAGLARPARPALARHRHRPGAAQHAALPAPEVRRPEGRPRRSSATSPAGTRRASPSSRPSRPWSTPATPRPRTAAFDTTTGWFAGCTMPQTQLLGVRKVTRLGDEAQQYALRAWHRPAMTFVLGVARTGRMTTVALTRTVRPRAGPTWPATCGSSSRRSTTSARPPPAARCSSLPKAVVDARAAGRPAADDAQRVRPAAGGRRRAPVGRHHPASGRAERRRHRPATRAASTATGGGTTRPGRS